MLSAVRQHRDKRLREDPSRAETKLSCAGDNCALNYLGSESYTATLGVNCWSFVGFPVREQKVQRFAPGEPGSAKEPED